MSRLLNISERASLALHGLVYLARSDQGIVSIRDLSSNLGVSQPHLAKVFQKLSEAGLARSKRGPAGGFALGRPPSRITLLDLYEAVEGKVVMKKCPVGWEKCVFEKCLFATTLAKAEREIYGILKNTRVSDLA